MLTLYQKKCSLVLWLKNKVNDYYSKLGGKNPKVLIKLQEFRLLQNLMELIKVFMYESSFTILALLDFETLPGDCCPATDTSNLSLGLHLGLGGYPVPVIVTYTHRGFQSIANCIVSHLCVCKLTALKASLLSLSFLFLFGFMFLATPKTPQQKITTQLLQVSIHT